MLVGKDAKEGLSYQDSTLKGRLFQENCASLRLPGFLLLYYQQKYHIQRNVLGSWMLLACESSVAWRLFGYGLLLPFSYY
jgi:hypothetical protein